MEAGGRRISCPPGAAKAAGGGAFGVSGIGPELVNGWAASGETANTEMTSVIPSAPPAFPTPALMLGFSAEIAANSSLGHTLSRIVSRGRLW